MLVQLRLLSSKSFFSEGCFIPRYYLIYKFIKMKNAEILANSFNQWASPIITAAMENMANQSQLGYFVSMLIPPQRLMQSMQQYIAAPTIYKYVSKVPDDIIPEFSLDIIDGMIETRVQQGVLEIPFIQWTLGADAFRKLKEICAANFAEYGEVKQEQALDAASQTTV